MRWQDIPQFLHGGDYGVDCEMAYLERWLNDARKTGLDLDPDFQRGHIWNDSQRTKYIEYLLQGGVSSRTIYWNCPGWMTRKESHCDLSDDIVIVDGKQRLTAMLKFLNGEIKAFGHRFDEFEGRARLAQGRFRMQVNNLQTRRELLTWYLQLNDGGVVHSQDELDRVRALLTEEEGR